MKLIVRIRKRTVKRAVGFAKCKIRQMTIRACLIINVAARVVYSLSRFSTCDEGVYFMYMTEEQGEKGQDIRDKRQLYNHSISCLL